MAHESPQRARSEWGKYSTASLFQLGDELQILFPGCGKDPAVGESPQPTESYVKSHNQQDR